MTRYTYCYRCVAMLFFLFTLNAAHAQSSDNQSNKVYKNSINLEMLGHGFGYTLSYERVFVANDFFRTTGQIGFAYYGTNSDATPLWIPITISQLKPLGNGEFLEIGAGRMIRSHMPLFGDASGKGGLRMEEWIMRLGLRMQPPGKRFQFRIAYTPFLRPSGITHWGAMGLGVQF
ncbi:MAG: hypothetical protein AB8G22_28240 [Saprospiraceae bacterium]